MLGKSVKEESEAFILFDMLISPFSPAHDDLLAVTSRRNKPQKNIRTSGSESLTSGRSVKRKITLSMIFELVSVQEGQ